MSQCESRLVRLARVRPLCHGLAGVEGAAPALVRLPRHPLVEQLVLSQKARRRSVRNDTRPDLLEDVLGYRHPQHALHMRYADAGVCRELLEGSLAANRNLLCQAEAGYALGANKLGCLPASCISYLNCPFKYLHHGSASGGLTLRLAKYCAGPCIKMRSSWQS